MDLNIALRTRQLRYVPVELNERDLKSLERICGMKLEPFAWILALPKAKREKVADSQHAEPANQKRQTA